MPLNVFTSCLRNAIFNFLAANNYIEHEIQKGFTSGLSGTFEHTAQMADIINKARTKQRSLVITLLDLENAFGEVHHNLIPTAQGNDGFLLTALKTLFRLSKVLLDLYKYIFICAIKFIYAVILGQLESFQLPGLQCYFPEIFRCNLKFYEIENFSDSSSHSIFESENFRFPFSVKNSLTRRVKLKKIIIIKN